MYNRLSTFFAVITVLVLFAGSTYIIQSKVQLSQKLIAYISDNYLPDEEGGSSEKVNTVASNLSADVTSREKLTLEIQPEASASDDEIAPQSPQIQGTKYIKLLFVGDIMLGRYVRTLMERNGLDYPFARALKNDYLKGKFDKVIGNLEGPIVPVPVRSQTGMVFGFAPDTGKILKRNGIDIVSLANNHALDQGQKGFESTKKYLAEAGVEYFGNAVMPTESEVLIRTINNKRFAFIGFHDATRRLNDTQAVQLVQKIDPQVDVTVIMIHWGIEYKKNPSARQKQLAHAFIDAGADLIIGHHPHVSQTIENYKGVHIIYSLGNFIFDQYWSAETQKGMTVEAVLSTDPADDSIKIFEHPVDIIASQPSWK